MSVTSSSSAELTVIRLDGEVDITVAAELKAALLEAVEHRREIRISIESASALDVTAFQLLWSAEREARRIGLRFSITQGLGEPIRRSLECMGLNGLLDSQSDDYVVQAIGCGQEGE